MKNAIIGLLVLAVLAGGAWYFLNGNRAGGGPGAGAGPSAGRARGAPTVVVVAQPARRQQVVDTVEALGTTQANESVTITAKVTDTVREVDFDDGDTVAKGDILVELTNAEESAQLAEEKANLEDAGNQLRRISDLARRGLASQSELDAAKSSADAAQARLDSITARLDDRLIRAPFSGALGFRQVSPGTLVTPNTAITTLDDISVVKLDFTVPEVYLDQITPGYMVYARSATYPDREFVGTVRTIGSRVDPVTRAVPVRAVIDNADGALRPGMLLTVRAVTSRRQALVVSETALTQEQDRAYVFVVGADGRAHRRQVQLGTRSFGTVEITDGLEAGEMVVVEGVVKLRDGVPLQLLKSATASADSQPGQGSAGATPAGYASESN